MAWRWRFCELFWDHDRDVEDIDCSRKWWRFDTGGGDVNAGDLSQTPHLVIFSQDAGAVRYLLVADLLHIQFTRFKHQAISTLQLTRSSSSWEQISLPNCLSCRLNGDLLGGKVLQLGCIACALDLPSPRKPRSATSIAGRIARRDPSAMFLPAIELSRARRMLIPLLW